MQNDALFEQVLTYIDDHLGEPLNIETLAAVAGFSPYHFCRVFQWRIGYPAMEYVRHRRLAFAAAELATDRRILDIAISYGFETHSGFSKAFRRRFGSTPEAYRLHARFEIPARPSLQKMQHYSIGGIVMEPKFVTLPAIPLAGYLLKTTSSGGQNYNAIPAFWQAYMTDGRMQKLHSQPFLKEQTEYGVSFMADGEEGAIDYVIGVETLPGAEIPAEFHRCEIPAATYAVFATPPSDRSNFVQNIQGVWQYIYGEWFPTAGYEFAPGCADFERYDERCMGESGMVCEIYLPVIRAQ